MQTEEIEDIVEKGSDAMTVRRVFGDPIEHDGITLIPVAKVRGGGGGGSGEGPDAKGKGWGAGFGMTARAMGTYVIKGEDVRFVPAIDMDRAIMVIGLVLAAAFLSVGKPLAKALLKGRKPG